MPWKYSSSTAIDSMADRALFTPDRVVSGVPAFFNVVKKARYSPRFTSSRAHEPNTGTPQVMERLRLGRTAVYDLLRTRLEQEAA